MNYNEKSELLTNAIQILGAISTLQTVRNNAFISAQDLWDAYYKNLLEYDPNYKITLEYIEYVYKHFGRGSLFNRYYKDSTSDIVDGVRFYRPSVSINNL